MMIKQQIKKVQASDVDIHHRTQAAAEPDTAEPTTATLMISTAPQPFESKGVAQDVKEHMHHQIETLGERIPCLRNINRARSRGVFSLPQAQNGYSGDFSIYLV